MPLFHLIPLLLIETQILLLKNALNFFEYQALSCLGRALRLLQESLNLSAIGSKSVSRLKKKPSW